MNTDESENTSRPFGSWLKAADRLMAAEFAAAFEAEGISRRDWRLLNIVDGTVPVDRPLREHKLRRLVGLGWIENAGDSWTLTDEGRSAKQRLAGIVDGIRAKVSDAVSPEDLATTLASLEQIARAFGWEEGVPLPRRSQGHRHGGFGHGPHGFPGRDYGRHGFGRHGFGGHGFGHAGLGHDGPGHHDFPGHDFDGQEFDGRGSDRGGPHSHAGHHDFPGHGFDHGSDRGGEFRDGHGHHTGFGRGRSHGPRHLSRVVQHSYERGFDAGFTRGRDA